MKITFQKVFNKFLGTNKKKMLMACVFCLIAVVFYRVFDIIKALRKIKNEKFKISSVSYSAERPNEFVITGRVENIHSPLHLSLLWISGSIKGLFIENSNLLDFKLDDIKFNKHEPLAFEAKLIMNKLHNASIIELLCDRPIDCSISFGIRMRFLLIPFYFYISHNIPLTSPNESDDSSSFEFSKITDILKLEAENIGDKIKFSVSANKKEVIELIRKNFPSANSIKLNIESFDILFKTNLDFIENFRIKTIGGKNGRKNSDLFLISLDILKSNGNYKDFVFDLIKDYSADFQILNIITADGKSILKKGNKIPIMRYLTSKETRKLAVQTKNNSQQYFADVNFNGNKLNFKMILKKKNYYYSYLKLLNILMQNQKFSGNLISGSGRIATVSVDFPSRKKSEKDNALEDLEFITFSVYFNDLEGLLNHFIQDKTIYFICDTKKSFFSVLDGFFFVYNFQGYGAYGFDHKFQTFEPPLRSIVRNYKQFPKDERGNSSLLINHTISSSSVKEKLKIDSKAMFSRKPPTSGFIKFDIPTISIEFKTPLFTGVTNISFKELFYDLNPEYDLLSKIRGNITAKTSIWPLISSNFADKSLLENFQKNIFFKLDQICSQEIAFKILIDDSSFKAASKNLFESTKKLSHSDGLQFISLPFFFFHMHNDNPHVFEFEIKNNNTPDSLSFNDIFKSNKKKYWNLYDFLIHPKDGTPQLFMKFSDFINNQIALSWPDINDQMIISIRNVFHLPESISLAYCHKIKEVENVVFSISLIKPFFEMSYSNGQLYMFLYKTCKAFIFLGQLFPLPKDGLFRPVNIENDNNFSSKFLSKILNDLIKSNPAKTNIVPGKDIMSCSVIASGSALEEDFYRVNTEINLNTPDQFFKMPDLIRVGHISKISFSIYSKRYFCDFKKSPMASFDLLPSYKNGVLTQLTFKSSILARIHDLTEETVFAQISIDDNQKHSNEIYFKRYFLEFFKDSQDIILILSEYFQSVPEIIIQNFTAFGKGSTLNFTSEIIPPAVLNRSIVKIGNFLNSIPFFIFPKSFILSTSINIKPFFFAKHNQNVICKADISSISFKKHIFFDVKDPEYSNNVKPLLLDLKIECVFENQTLKIGGLSFALNFFSISNLNFYFFAQTIFSFYLENVKRPYNQTPILIRLHDKGMATIDFHLPFKIKLVKSAISLVVPLSNELFIFCRLLEETVDSSAACHGFTLSIPLRLYTMPKKLLPGLKINNPRTNVLKIGFKAGEYSILFFSPAILNSILAAVLTAHYHTTLCSFMPTYHELNNYLSLNAVPSISVLINKFIGPFAFSIVYNSLNEYCISRIPEQYIKNVTALYKEVNLSDYISEKYPQKIENLINSMEEKLNNYCQSEEASKYLKCIFREFITGSHRPN